MELYPALDIAGGRVARGGAGSKSREDPVALAQWLIGEGATRLHVVDLDRALRTGSDNLTVVQRVLELDVAVQIGGNVDDPGWARAVARSGAARIVLGTSVALERELLTNVVAACESSETALAVETRAGGVYLRDRDVTIPTTMLDLVETAQDAGVRAFVYRDVERDGTLAGAALAGAAPLLDAGVHVIYAGGVESLDDIRAARKQGFHGLIVGRALLSGRFSVTEALACCQ